MSIREWLYVAGILLALATSAVGGAWSLVSYLAKRDRDRVSQGYETLLEDQKKLQEDLAKVREDMGRLEERIKNRPDHQAIGLSLERLEKKLGDRVDGMEKRILEGLDRILKEKV